MTTRTLPARSTGGVFFNRSMGDRTVKTTVRAIVAVSAAGIGASAFAAVPQGVETAIQTGGTDAATVAAAVFVAIVGVFAIKLMRRGL